VCAAAGVGARSGDPAEARGLQCTAFTKPLSSAHATPGRHGVRTICTKIGTDVDVWIQMEGRVPASYAVQHQRIRVGSSPTVQGPDAAARTARGSRLRQEPRDGGIVFDVMEERFIVMRDSCFFSSEDMPACNRSCRFDLGDFFAGTLRSRVCRHRRFFHRARQWACLVIFVGFGSPRPGYTDAGCRFALLPLPAPRYCI
jgi:hypothetical protein